MMLRRILLALLLLASGVAPLHAAGPRWVSGPPWQNDGKAVAWYRNDVRYFVDAGALSTSVSNADAVRMVDAAAKVWNIQYSNLVLSNGGSLNEDVSSANVYLGSSGPIWPSDVDMSNYTAKQIAVIFDGDGTLIDMLLGSGASAPTSCRQNGVVESVDKFIQPGAIAHAIILVNGRCTGAVAEQQLQLQYQLMRVFGRVIGLAWSQLNDNVFTGTPSPTYQQQLHWPIMHPIDIVCGAYTYQCLPNPFTLRDDDRCAVRLLYGVSYYVSTDGVTLTGHVSFPTGQGMDGVNLVAVRQSPDPLYGTESWQTASAVSGMLYRQNAGNAATGALTQYPALQGSLYPPYQGYWTISGLPAIIGRNWNNVLITPENVNPLYRGAYSVGPTATGILARSGAAQVGTASQVGRIFAANVDMTLNSATNDCTTGSDGTERAPVAVAATGTWSGKLCAWGHSSWGTFNVQAGRTATLEVMALDENGAASINKMHPVLGVWHGSSATGTLPTLAKAGTSFNGRQTGTTQVTAGFTATEAVRFVVADERGNGRPDFAYSARLLYAAAVSPARLGDAGGAIRITGMGFQPGNAVTVGGVSATVISLSATEIVATAPTLAAVGGSSSNDVTVTDLRTGGKTTISGGLLYGSSTGDVLTVVQAPAASVAVGAPAPLQVKLANSASAPVAGAAITFRVTGGTASIAPCGGATCTVATDATGMALVRITASAAGSVALQASTASGAQTAVQFAATVASQSATALRPTEYVAAVPGAPLQPALVLASNGLRSAGVPVAWATLSGTVTLNGAQSTTAADGTAVMAATADLQPGAQAVVQGCAWANVCTNVTLIGTAPGSLRIEGVSGDAQIVKSGSRLGTLVLRVTDGALHGVAGATVDVRQQVTGWQPACPATGRCSTPPVYGTSSTTAVSDDDGLIVVSPLQYDGTAADTRIVASTGANGYFALTLSKVP